MALNGKYRSTVSSILQFDAQLHFCPSTVTTGPQEHHSATFPAAIVSNPISKLAGPLLDAFLPWAVVPSGCSNLLGRAEAGWELLYVGCNLLQALLLCTSIERCGSRWTESAGPCWTLPYASLWCQVAGRATASAGCSTPKLLPVTPLNLRVHPFFCCWAVEFLSPLKAGCAPL
ncbi:hypothetical protein VIGAN_11133200 [Vigna angularis var. angularis]|uniref:Uncharacterized protein n=1 Tax=Vigna angularis var. angularis TaxID=157739 RepID=A0A0S3TAA9_PHAAN|nr:hypothetical protein VIGAN_11133200 [Vigna angularis var. angularis]